MGGDEDPLPHSLAQANVCTQGVHWHEIISKRTRAWCKEIHFGKKFKNIFTLFSRPRLCDAGSERISTKFLLM